ncbi:MAG: hypothetical protein H0X30_20760 [Anaerolineae bacterium]|nr:hypothetical protein [Anaerolineae bacterium]
MVKKLEHLTFTNELKINLLRSTIKENVIPVSSFDYDAEFDALTLRFIQDTPDVIVHYIDDHVGLLYQPETKEIVGIQIEDFGHSFLPHHDAIRKVWNLTSTDSRIENVGDLQIIFERKKPQIAREVFKLTENLLEKQGFEFGDFLK